MVKKIAVLGLVGVASLTFAIHCPKCGNPNHKCGSVNAAVAVQNELNITAKAAFLVEANSGKVLFSKDENKRLPIASMTKITTLAVIYDALKNGELKMDDKVMVSKTASGMGGSQAFLDFDAEYVVEDLIKSIIIASANDSCVALAEKIAGSETEFVARMNKLAASLDMTNTKYANCTGLPAAESYSCAADVAKIYSYLMKSPYYNYKSNEEPINKIWMYDLTHPSGRVTGLTNTNKHVRFMNECLGGKTGFTAEAGHCITIAAQKGEMKPVAVIIGASNSDTRFAESRALVEHVFNAYENRLIVDANAILGSVEIKRGLKNSVEVRAKENYYKLLKKGEPAAASVAIELNKDAKAPVDANTALGKVIVLDEGNVVREIAIVPVETVKELGYMDAVKVLTKKFKL